MSDKKVVNPYTSEELRALLVELTRQRYNDSGVADIVSDLSQVSQPGRLAMALIEAIAEIWGENNRRLADYSRRTGFGGGGRRY